METEDLGRSARSGNLAFNGLEDTNDVAAFHLVEGQIRGLELDPRRSATFSSASIFSGSARCSTRSEEVRTARSITFCNSRTLPGQW